MYSKLKFSNFFFNVLAFFGLLDGNFEGGIRDKVVDEDFAIPKRCNKFKFTQNREEMGVWEVERRAGSGPAGCCPAARSGTLEAPALLHVTCQHSQ